MQLKATAISFCLAASLGGTSARQLMTIHETPVAGKVTPWGCFDSIPENAQKLRSMTFLSVGVCTDACLARKRSVALITGNDCYCSDLLPFSKSQVADDDCNYPCPGYAMNACGSLDGDVSVYHTGLSVAVKEEGAQDDNDDTDGYMSMKALMAIASGAWSTGEGAASNVVSNVCNYFNCGKKRETSKEKV